MKNTLTTFAIVFAITASAFAHPAHRMPPPPRHHHHHHAGVVAAASVVGFALGAATAYAQSSPTYVREPVVVQTPVVQPVYQQPVVVQQPQPTYVAPQTTYIPASTATVTPAGAQVIGYTVQPVVREPQSVRAVITREGHVLIPEHYEYHGGYRVLVPDHYVR